MTVETLPVDSVQEWEKNARIHTKRNLDALKASLREYGQTKPILVQKSTMRIIAGNGTYQAIKALGWDKVDCRILDLDDTQAEALMIADNRIGDLSDWDEKNLLDSLQSIKTAGNLELTGYDDLELDKMLSFKSPDAFAELDAVAKKPKKKPQKDDFPTPPATPTVSEGMEIAPAEDQICFTVDGFVFSLANPEEIKELRCLISLLKESSDEDREDVINQVFKNIQEVLTNKFLR